MHTYFTPKPQTLEELKKMYHKLAIKFHPDCGGTDEAMKAINAEYERLFAQVKNVHHNKDGATYEKATEETPDQFKDIISKLIHMQGITIEIIGSFVWLSGNTKTYKDQIKALGFKWSQNKTAWYLAPKGYKRHGKGTYTMSDIRGMYGSRSVETEKQVALAV